MFYTTGQYAANCVLQNSDHFWESTSSARGIHSIAISAFDFRRLKGHIDLAPMAQRVGELLRALTYFAAFFSATRTNASRLASAPNSSFADRKSTRLNSSH